MFFYQSYHSCSRRVSVALISRCVYSSPTTTTATSTTTAATGMTSQVGIDAERSGGEVEGSGDVARRVGDVEPRAKKPTFKSYFSHTEDDLIQSKYVKEKERWQKMGLAPPAHYRHIYPEFLPHRDPRYRNFLMEKLERLDMIRRRKKIEIPEFFVGSILAVTVSDVGAPGKFSRFVGICTFRMEHGLRHKIILRNVIDGEGVEVIYDLYSPVIQKVEVLKLERRLDDHLLYLRDALPEHSFIPQDMAPVPHVPGTPVPLNTTKVTMKEGSWSQKWFWLEPQGIRAEDLEEIPQEKYLKRWRKNKMYQFQIYDFMKSYRSSITKEDQDVIFSEVYEAELEKIREREESQRGRVEGEGKRRKRKEWERRREW